MYNLELCPTKAVLFSIDSPHYNTNTLLDELSDLSKSVGFEESGRIIQKRENPHNIFYFGKGKLEELKQYINESNSKCVICDDELSPRQIKNIHDFLEVEVFDRTMIILQIFSISAKSSEAIIQVELANLKYTSTRLIGQGISMSRLGGGSSTKTRGAGEKKLELDRRTIKDRIFELEKDLEQIKTHRNLLRENKNSFPVISLVGYTNAGKSTLMNLLTNSDVEACDRLFVTLDTTMRKFLLSNNLETMLVDTVGFIQKLPHTLIKAFNSTLEELKFSDILIHVIDYSDSNFQDHIAVVQNTLKLLNCDTKPTIYVFNKSDKININNNITLFNKNSVLVSAKTGEGIQNLKNIIEKTLSENKISIKILLPFDKFDILDIIHTNCNILSKEYCDTGVVIDIFAQNNVLHIIKDYII